MSRHSRWIGRVLADPQDRGHEVRELRDDRRELRRHVADRRGR